MKYLSLCSGIEAASVAWQPLGWEPVAFAEFDAFPSAVLHHHYPDTPNLGDISKTNGTKYKERADLIVGGTPCQSFSVAGLREGLDDERGNLAFEFCRIVREVQPLWFVWENVPGVLSSNEGRDFGSIIGAMAELGYGVCWRVLDAQFFGVAQRRKRLFVVGYLGDWRPASAVLFEPESVRGDSTACRKTGKGIAGTPAACPRGGGRGGVPSSRGEHTAPTVGALCARDYKGVGSQFVDEGKVFPEVAQTITSRDHKGVSCGRDGVVGNPVIQACAKISPSLTSRGPPFSRTGNSRVEAEAMVVTPINDKATRRKGGGSARNNDGAGNGLGVGKEGDPSPTLTGGDRHAICIQGSMIGRKEENGPQGDGVNEEVSFTQNATDRHCVAYGNQPTNSRTKETDQAPPVHSADVYNQTTEEGLSGTATAATGGTNTSGPKVIAPTITTTNSPQSSEVTQQVSAVHAATKAVRRLTPIECERLQGFPDDYTKIPYRGKGSRKCPDGPRYKALGNSMAVPVVRWIGERIELFMRSTAAEEDDT